MSKKHSVRVSMMFEDADPAAGVVRIAVIVEDWGKKPTADPIKIMRTTPGGVAKQEERLAVVTKQANAWSELAVADGKTLVYQLPAPEVAGGHLYVRWVVYVETSVGGKAPYLQVRHPRAGVVTKRISTLASQLNKSQPQDAVLTPDAFPRLSVALNAAPVPVNQPAGNDPALGNAPDIASLLVYVYFRLRTPSKGVHAGDRPDALAGAWAWASKLALLDKLPAGREITYAEEAWARKLTELTAFTPYAGTGEMYFGAAKYDSELIAKSVQDDSSSDPIYGLTFACQHLAHFGVASRGRAAHVAQPYGQGLRLLNAGSGSATTVMQMHGAWIIGGNPPKPAQAPAAKPLGAVDLVCDDALKHAPALFSIEGVVGTHTFAAGAVFAFGNRPARPEFSAQTGFDSWETVKYEGSSECTYRGPKAWPKLKSKLAFDKDHLLGDNEAGAHIGLVLRIDRVRKKFQALDTGALNVPGRETGVTTLPAGHRGGNYDGPSTDHVNGPATPPPLPHTPAIPATPLRGVGVWTPMTKSDAGAMDKHVRNVLARARPLGLVRLLIMPPGVSLSAQKVVTVPPEQWLVYASPLLRMYENDAEQNFAISRYLWSLRGVPRGTADVWWFIYVPQHALARAMIDGGRTATVPELAQAAFASMDNPKQRHSFAPKGELDVALLLAHYTHPILEIKAEAGGTVDIHYRFDAHPKKTGPKPSPVHIAENKDWQGKIHLPMDKEFLASGETGASSHFPLYFTSP